MLETQDTALLEAFAEALETMAFACIEPASAPCAAPEEPLSLTLRYKCPQGGAIELIAPRQLGAYLAANVLADEADPASAQQSADTLKELLNVTCGMLLRRLRNATGGAMEMGLPQIRDFDPATWDQYINSAGVCLLNVEGFTVAVRCREDS